VDATGLVTLNGVLNYGSIDAAVSAAAAGGSVVVCDGTYTENVQIDDDLTLQSLNGPGSTTIDGDDDGACIAVAGGTVTIRGFTLTGGTGDAHPINPVYTVGGGVMILSSDPVTIADTVFLANEADYGAGLFGNDGCTVTITDSTFDLNNADNSGGAAYLWNCTASLDTVVLEDNYAEWGGALYVDEGTLDLDQCTLQDNYAASEGGGALLSGGVAVTASTDTLLTGNEASDVGGGLLMETGVTWTGGELYDNDADYGGQRDRGPVVRGQPGRHLRRLRLRLRRSGHRQQHHPRQRGLLGRRPVPAELQHLPGQQRDGGEHRQLQRRRRLPHRRQRAVVRQQRLGHRQHRQRSRRHLRRRWLQRLQRLRQQRDLRLLGHPGHLQLARPPYPRGSASRGDP
jgi:hypothetical protein